MAQTARSRGLVFVAVGAGVHAIVGACVLAFADNSSTRVRWTIGLVIPLMYTPLHLLVQLAVAGTTGLFGNVRTLVQSMLRLHALGVLVSGLLMLLLHLYAEVFSVGERYARGSMTAYGCVALSWAIVLTYVSMAGAIEQTRGM